MKKANLMALAIVILLGGCGQNDAADQQAIRQVMLKTWDGAVSLTATRLRLSEFAPSQLELRP